MWWRSNPMLGQALRVAAVIGLAALNAACFQPLYAAKTVTGTPLGTQLAQIDIDRIAAPNGSPQARIANEVRNQLDFELNGGGGLISPTHRLKVDITGSRASILTDARTGLVESEITGIDAVFTLVELSSGKAVMQARTFARVSSQYPGLQQRFARVRARLDAEDRAAKVIAENIRTRVASFFVAGT